VSGVDVAILAGLALFLARGLLNGFARELAPLVGAAAGLVAAFRLARPAALVAAEQWGWVAALPPSVRTVLAGGACFVVAYLLCRLTVLALAAAGGAGAAGRLTRAGGALVGLLKGGLVVGLALLGLSWLVAGPIAHRLLERSVLARELTRLSGSLVTWAHQWL